jgi:putative redox protein
MIKIELRRVSDSFHLEAVNEEGNAVELDASPDIGGTGKGMRPMQMLLSALGGCSSIDVLSMLKKQRQDLKDIRVTITGQRREGEVPSIFKNVHLHFKLVGDLDRDKVEKAVSLSVEKYCSVARILEKTAEITYDLEVLRG